MSNCGCVIIAAQGQNKNLGMSGQTVAHTQFCTKFCYAMYAAIIIRMYDCED